MNAGSRNARFLQPGYTIVELLAALVIAALLLSAISGVVNGALEARRDTTMRMTTMRDAEFAMQRLMDAVIASDRLVLPLADNPATNWREHVREQSVPPSPPEGDSTLATAVLAVTMSASLDIDQDGWSDANNDQDFKDFDDDNVRDPGEPERVDEDSSSDWNNDAASGIYLIDDDGDGAIDESIPADDDEDGLVDEDWLNGVDDDGDGAVDEDPPADANNDGRPGVADVDDDFDGTTDEQNVEDDDEDGSRNEDWLDVVVFYLSGSSLIERTPRLSAVFGQHFTESVIADNVTFFRVERVADAGQRFVLVDLTIEVRPPNGEAVRLTARARVGGSL